MTLHAPPQQTNCVSLFLERAAQHPERLALQVLGGEKCSFGALADHAAATQKQLVSAGVQAGDRVLVLDALGPRLYAAIVATLALGATVMLVEPWMPLQKLRHVVSTAQPAAFLHGSIGWLWGMRSAPVRGIPRWVRLRANGSTRNSSVTVTQVPQDQVAVLTFTSGTTSLPKGVVRTHRTLIHQHEMLTESLGLVGEEGADLCVFANFALSNLAAGRPSVIMPPRWSQKAFAALDGAAQPVSLTCGPAFLLKLMEQHALPPLENIHIGGALTDCWIFEKGFARWPAARWTHLYGSSEAEPVAAGDAREAVALSRERGYFQTLHLGTPVTGVRTCFKEQSVWVEGPHVCPYYIGADEANQKDKYRDENDRLWHRMGDRIAANDAGWWYQGRSQQPHAEFLLEQRIYSFMQSSKSFVDGSTLYGEGVRAQAQALKQRFPEIQELRELHIKRDARHRARIDRKRSLS